MGYYSRARNLHFSAKMIANELQGVFPSNYNELIQLKGVGDYTASAISSICFNEPQAVVDGNVYRVLARYFGIFTPINSSLGIKEFKELAQTLIDTKQPGTHNQAIMDFGALHCKPQNPLCETCPLNNSCVALKNQQIKELPVKEQKIKIRKRFFNYLVIVSAENKTVLSERKGKGIWQGLFEFPLIETEKGIDLQTLKTNLSIDNWTDKVEEIVLYTDTELIHKLSHQHIYTKFWIVKATSTNIDLIDWEEIEKYPVPTLIANFLKNFNPSNGYF